MNQHILNKYNHENSRKIQKIYNKKKKKKERNLKRIFFCMRYNEETVLRIIIKRR